MLFPLSYHFEPGHAHDGVSIHVPVNLLHQVPEYRLEWLVPGMLRDKCIALVKSLPKNLRKHFVPVPDVVDKVLASIAPDNKPLSDVLTLQLKRLTGVDVPVELWQQETIDHFYRFNIQVMDERGKCIASDRNLTQLREHYRERVQENIHSAAATIERDDICSWDFDRFEKTVQLNRNGLQIRAYPALVDKRKQVALQVLAHPLQAQAISRRGIARLLVLEAQAKTKYLHKELLKNQELALSIANIGNREQVVDDLLLAAWRNLCLPLGHELPDSRAAFDLCLQKGGEQIIAHTQELARHLTESFKLLVDVRKQLKQHNNALALAFTVTDIHTQLQHLLFPGLVYQTPPEWLAQYPRYLRALQLRLEKA